MSPAIKTAIRQRPLLCLLFGKRFTVGTVPISAIMDVRLALLNGVCGNYGMSVAGSG